MTAAASEGVVMEGTSNVKLTNTILNAMNRQLSDHADTHKTIFIGQTSGDAANAGTSYFTAANSVITTNKGDHFYVTNGNAQIDLSSTQFVQNDGCGAFMRVQAGYWGNSGSNGGHVVVNASRQEVIGNIYVDDISSVTLNLTSESYFKGALLGNGTKALGISPDSTIVLTSDVDVSEVVIIDDRPGENSGEASGDEASSGAGSINYSNIYGNGYRLYINGEEASINTGDAPESHVEYSDESRELAVLAAHANDELIGSGGFPTWGIVAIVGGVCMAAVIALGIFVLMKNKRNNDRRTK